MDTLEEFTISEPILKDGKIVGWRGWTFRKPSTVQTQLFADKSS